MWMLCRSCLKPGIRGFCSLCLESLIPSPELCPQCAFPQCQAAGFCTQPWRASPYIHSHHAAYLALGPGYTVLKNWKKRCATQSSDRLLPERVSLPEKMDYLVALPQRTQRAWTLGQSPAQRLAEHLEQILSTPLLPALQLGNKMREAQARKNREARLSDPISFEMKAGYESKVLGKKILLVDDFMSTGNTLKAAAQLLGAWGALRVRVYVLGRRLELSPLSRAS